MHLLVQCNYVHVIYTIQEKQLSYDNQPGHLYKIDVIHR